MVQPDSAISKSAKVKRARKKQKQKEIKYLRESVQSYRYLMSGTKTEELREQNRF